MSVEAILKTHRAPLVAELGALSRCIDECYECTAICTICADACLAEDDVRDLVRCARLCLDCADACVDTGRIASRQTQPDPASQRIAVEACRVACQASADECHRHAQHHEHCRLCEEECRRCIRACDELLAALDVEAQAHAHSG
jgi:hypothetical protein